VPASVTVQVTPLGPLVLNPAGISVAFGLGDIFGLNGIGSLISGPGAVAQDCAAPCSQFTASGGSFSGSLNLVDVWSQPSPYPNITFASTVSGTVSFTTGSSPSMTATNSWNVTSATGAFEANFGGAFLFTTAGAYTVTATCTSAWTPLSGTFCGANLAASIAISHVGGAQIQPVISTGSAQFVLPAAGQYQLTWQTLGGGSESGCCLGQAGSGAVPSGSASVAISVVFQPTG
jgi:hypothetical protein